MGLVARAMGWEERGHPSNLSGSDLEAWLAHGSLPGGSAAGVTVNQETALSSPAMLQGVRLISETVGRVPLGIYERTNPGRELLRNHPAHRVLQEPNEEITAVELRSMMQSFATTAGNGYAEIVFGGDGRPRELWPIPPHRVTPDRAANDRLIYRVQTQDGPRVLPLENVLHIPGFQRGGIMGLDTVRQMQEAVGLTLATEKFAGSFFGNGSFLSGWIKFPNRMSTEAKKNVRESLERKHTGLEKAHRIGFLEEGMEWAAAGVPPEQAQLIETRKFSVEEVARILNVPPHLLHHLERATFNNIEELGIAFVVYSLSSWWTRWEQRVAKRLLLPSDRARGLYAKHNANELLRGSPEKRAEFYDALHQIGVLSANDIRELEDMNPIEGGDRYFVRRDTIPLDSVDELVASLSVGQERAQLPPGPDTSLAQDFRPLFRERAETIVRREADGIRSALNKAHGGRDAVRLRTLIDDFYADHGRWVADHFRALVQSYGARIARSAAVVPIGTDAFLVEQARSLGEAWATEGAEQVRTLLADTAPEDVEAALEARLAEWEQDRAEDAADHHLEQIRDATAAFVADHR